MLNVTSHDYSKDEKKMLFDILETGLTVNTFDCTNSCEICKWYQVCKDVNRVLDSIKLELK